jgi:hypothetical protein
MRTWNFNSLNFLEEQVLVSGTGLRLDPIRRRPVATRRTQFTSAQLGFALAIAALSTVSVNVSLASSLSEVRLSTSASSISSNVRKSRPPLDLLFGGRFDSEWTEELEHRLLSSAAEKAFANHDEDKQNLVHTAQQESLSNDVPRLTKEAVLGLTPRRG